MFNIPDSKTISERRKPKFVVNPKDVTPKDDIRIRQWALGVMTKNSSRLDDSVPNKTIVFEKEVDAEEIDIKNVYPFKMRYFIMKKGRLWVLRLLYETISKKYSILAEFAYANIDHI